MGPGVPRKDPIYRQGWPMVKTPGALFSGSGGSGGKTTSFLHTRSTKPACPCGLCPAAPDLRRHAHVLVMQAPSSERPCGQHSPGRDKCPEETQAVSYPAS